MRLLKTFTEQAPCERLYSYLIVQGIPVEVHEEGSGLSLWIKNEDQVPKAKEILAKFEENPNASEFAGHERAAQQKLAEQQAHRERVARNTMQPGRNWRQSSSGGFDLSRAFQETPIICFTLLIAILVFVAPKFSFNLNAQPYLLFQTYGEIRGSQETGPLPTTLDLLPWSEPWRFLGPIFLHASVMHILFNCWCIWDFGRQIEQREGKWLTLLLIIFSGAASNTMQAMLVSPLFGGLSGVAYAMIGFVWMRLTMPAGQGYVLSPGTAVIAMIWLGLGFAQDLPGMNNMSGARMANFCHLGGLLAGVAVAAILNSIPAVRRK